MAKQGTRRHHGHVKEVRPGVWRIRVERGVTLWRGAGDEPTRRAAKARVYSETFEGSRAEAEERADAIWVEMGEDRNIGDRMTLGEYFDELYVPDHLSRRRKKTQSKYTSIFDRYIRPVFGNDWPPDISYRRGQRWIDEVESPAQQREVLLVARAVVHSMEAQLAIREPVVFLNKLELRHKQVHRKDTWTAEDVLEGMRRLRDTRMERLFLVMAGAGTRRSEALALRCPDDFVFEVAGDGAVLARAHIRATYTAEDGLLDLTKTGRDRAITIGEPFSSRLRELMPEEGCTEPILPSLRRRRTKDEMENGLPGGDEFFDGCLVASVTPRTVADIWKKLFDEPRPYQLRTRMKTTKGGPLAGMDFIELESLRHTNETLAVEAGLSSTITSLAHGHSQEISYGHYLGQRGVADANAEAVRRRIEGEVRE